MSDTLPAQIVCRRCSAVLDAADNYCRRCGTPTAGQPGWWESPWFVLAMLFLVLGPFALPLLWRSRRFTLPWKGVLTVLVAGWTMFLLWRTWFAVQQALGLLQEWQKFQRF
jgi:hypothetical protein